MENDEVDGKPVTLGDAVQIALFGSNEESKVSFDNGEEEKELKEESATEEEEKNDKFNEETSTPLEASTLSANKNKITLNLSGRSISMDSESKIESLRSRRSRIKKFKNKNLRDRNILRKIRNELSLDKSDEDVDTGKYMYGAMWACGCMLLWKQKWILSFLIIPFVWYVVKQVSRSFGFSSIIKNHLNSLIIYSKNWYQERQEAIIPAHIRGLYKVYIIIDKKLSKILKGSVDSVATIIVILGLIIFVFCSSIFIVVQIYAEGIHIVQVSGEILNSTLVNNPDIDWLPQQWEDSVNSLLDNAYTYGRTAISDGVKNLVKDMEVTKAELIEKKVVELWDRLYQAWMMSTEPDDLIGPTVNALTVWESLKENFGKMPTQIFHINSLQNFAKDNIGILLSVLDSVWSIVKGNMSIVMSIFTELMYLVLMSGSVLLNFTLSTVVFFTTLFYLLSSSGNVYKPIELVGVFSPISCNR